MSKLRRTTVIGHVLLRLEEHVKDTIHEFKGFLKGLAKAEYLYQLNEYKRTGGFTCSAFVAESTPGYIEERIAMFESDIEAENGNSRGAPR